jgi:hypothetical protein
METKKLKPNFVLIDSFAINLDEISYFQHGISAETKLPFIKFKMICGDYVNFDFKVYSEYEDKMDQIIENFSKESVETWEKPSKSPKKIIKKSKNVISIDD